jgi:hypothetical protein
MRLGIAIGAAALALTGCGDGTGPTQAPAPTNAAAPVVLVSQSNGGGASVGSTLRPLTSVAEVDGFVGEFDAGFAATLRKSIQAYDVPVGHQLEAAVAYVGCGTPDGARVVGDRLVPGDAHDANIDCLVAVTTVGLVAVPRDAY